MYEVCLTTEEKACLESRHRKTKSVKESDRLKAILLRSEGWSVVSISQALRVHECTITRYIKDYLKHQKLEEKKGGSSSFLSAEQSDLLISHLSNHLYHYTHEIVAYVESRWGVKYTVPGLNKWLHRNGFSYKKPKGRPYKADEKSQVRFIDDYNALKERLKPTEPLFFMDSVHPSQSTKLSYGWIRKGETVEISTTASRTRMNIVGAINLNDIGGALIADYETINGKAIEDFLTKLRKKHPIEHQVHIILDRAGYHRSESLRERATALNIELHYLPAYSPNLNPIERLWKVMNEHARNNRFFASPKEFRGGIKAFFEKTLPEIAHTLSDRINDNFQRLKPAL